MEPILFHSHWFAWFLLKLLFTLFTFHVQRAVPYNIRIFTSDFDRRKTKKNIHLCSHTLSFILSVPQRITKPILFMFRSGHEYRRLLFSLSLFAPIEMCWIWDEKKFPQYVRNMFAKINLVSFCVTTNKHKLSSGSVRRREKLWQIDLERMCQVFIGKNVQTYKR